jgi:hypothetical protein
VTLQTCVPENFRLCRWGEERTIKRAQMVSEDPHRRERKFRFFFRKLAFMSHYDISLFWWRYSWLKLFFFTIKVSTIVLYKPNNIIKRNKINLLFCYYFTWQTIMCLSFILFCQFCCNYSWRRSCTENLKFEVFPVVFRSWWKYATNCKD